MWKTGDSYKKLVVFNDTGDSNDLASIQTKWCTDALAPLPEDHIRIHVHYSSINYKDALALTGKGKILRTLPLTPGIDASGVVLDSRHKNFNSGDEVLVTGCGLGESVDGGYSQVIQVPSSWVIHKPNSLSLKDTMILGTAGFTAALAINQLVHNGLKNNTSSVLVTGATGGVGSLAILMLKNQSFSVEAWSQKKDASAFLKKLAVDKITDPHDLMNKQTRPLETSQWSAAIDNVGGDILGSILPRISPHGGVACVGMALSPHLHTTVFPFILRGVHLLGISSSTCPRPVREKIWNTINTWDCDWNACLQNTLTANEILPFAQKMIAGKTMGRSVVDVLSF